MSEDLNPVVFQKYYFFGTLNYLNLLFVALMFKSYEIEMNNFFKIHVSEQVLDMFNEAKMKVVVISFGSLKVNLKSNHVNCMYSEITGHTFVKTYDPMKLCITKISFLAFCLSQHS